MRSCQVVIRGPDSSSNADRPPCRAIENCVTAANISAAMVIGVPPAVPNSSPLAPASSW